ncbi:MAG: hypothetical protein PHY08_04175 [Candidatus Cloacimonetes bacterium]|nr:hypothetical protein [Candidatus Cloacimonadota bacterium]
MLLTLRYKINNVMRVSQLALMNSDVVRASLLALILLTSRRRLSQNTGLAVEAGIEKACPVCHSERSEESHLIDL